MESGREKGTVVKSQGCDSGWYSPDGIRIILPFFVSGLRSVPSPPEKND